MEPEPAEDDHREDEDREAELELVGVDARVGRARGRRPRCRRTRRPPRRRAASSCTSGTPMLAAATSSSRSAIQARPRRESRRRKFTNSTTRHSARTRPVVRPRLVAWSNSPKNGRSIWSIGEIDWRPLVSLLSPNDRDLVAVVRDAADDLAEGERDDRDVVAAQAQRRQADDHAGDRADEDRADRPAAGSSGGCRAGCGEAR